MQEIKAKSCPVPLEDEIILPRKIAHIRTQASCIQPTQSLDLNIVLSSQSCAKLLVSKPLLILISKFSENIDIESILVSKYPWKGY